MIGAFMAGGFLFNENVSGAGEPQFESVRIKAGDTVWGIARDYGPANGDTRTLVEAICDLNEIDPGRIYPGQTIMVPIYENA
jgi:nucleoid-associated protein YgaU